MLKNEYLRLIWRATRPGIAIAQYPIILKGNKELAL
jgi:hypothetical protein